MIDALTARLAELAALNQTTSYGQLARDLNLTGPATIARLSEVEILIRYPTVVLDVRDLALIRAHGVRVCWRAFSIKIAGKDGCIQLVAGTHRVSREEENGKGDWNEVFHGLESGITGMDVPVVSW